MASQRVQRQIDRLLDEAEAAVQQSNWALVQNRARNVLAFDPENRDAQAFLAAAARALSIPGASLAVEPDSPSGPIPAPPSPTTPTSPSAELRTSFAGGRYQVKKFLGEGGKKRVYLAYDTLLDRDVAFALIKAEGLDEVARSRIRREAQAMGRLGSHPHIVTVFDLGQEEGRGGFETRPYLVAELMGGGDVEAAIEAASDHRLPLEQAINIAQQVCQGLEFAHAKGIVHRDLKPGNVWLTAEGTAKIGDFGLALPLDRPRLTQEGMMVGTVAYMPPEQAMGGEVTPRSDLYSLGAMLYEMVTGRPPFLGDDPVAIIGQHINTPPVAPSWHNGQCPRPLEALILRLLAKDPSERPGSASDVRAALEGINLTDVGAQHAAPLQDQAHALDSLAGGVFVGRQREMGELKAALEDALSGRGRLVTLVGEPGIGKTRTAQELATYAGLRQCQVLWGRCYEGQGAPSYWPWVQAIRSYVRDRDAAQLRSEMGAGAADIAEVVSDVKERLPDLKPPPQLEPEQSRFRLFDSIAAFLKSAGRRQPLVLVLEDLHWADRPSLLLLEFLARELGASRLLVIGTYRDMEVSRHHPLSQTLGELTRERLFQRVLLRGLSQGDVGRFIELVAGIARPRGMVAAVYRQTEGNPLFVTEVVRLLVQEGALTPDVGAHSHAPLQPGTTSRESWTVRIPEGVREVIGRRLDRLSERCNQTLTIASVIGREFTLEQLKPLVEDPSTGSGQAMTEDRLLEVVDEALAARVIEELPRTVGRYQFTHALIQETLLEELSTTRRVRLHARIAEALEELYGDAAEAHAAELAHHFAEAQTVLGTQKLVRYSLLAGERALASYGWEEAQAHFERALAAKGVALAGTEPAKDADIAAVLFGLGRAQGATGQVHEAWHTLNRCFEYYEGSGHVDLAVAVAEYPLLFVTGLSRVTQVVERALKLVPPDSHEAGRLMSRYGLLLNLETGDYERAREAFDGAMAIAKREGDVALEMRTLANAADADWYQCRGQEVLNKSLRDIELAKRANDPRTEVWPRFLAAFELVAMGDPTEANEHAQEMLAKAERLRDRGLVALACLANLNVSRVKGDWLAARSFSERGLDLEPRQPWILGLRTVLEHEVGELGSGVLYLERLLDVMRATAPGPTAEYHFPAWVIPVIGRITGNVERFDRAEEAAQVVLSSSIRRPLAASLVVGRALMPVQRHDSSMALLQHAAILQWWGETIMDQAMAVGMPSVHRVLGLLTQTMGQLDKSAEHFEDALAFCRKAGYRPELAWACCDYADCLLARAQQAAPLPDDRAKAMALLDEALAISRELGMRPLMERVLSRREILTA